MDFGSRGGEWEGGDTQEPREWDWNAEDLLRGTAPRRECSHGKTPDFPTPSPNSAAPGEDFGPPGATWPLQHPRRCPLIPREFSCSQPPLREGVRLRSFAGREEFGIKPAPVFAHIYSALTDLF